MKNLLLILITAWAFSLIGCTTIQTAADAKWEYQVINHRVYTSLDHVQRELNELGEEGWLVVSSNTIVDHNGTTQRRETILKRQK